jgi:pimeloyl-ACP methyl ester carboxylesterase
VERFTSFDGTEIAFQDVGEGRPVVLLHGFSVDAERNFGPWSAVEPWLVAVAQALTGSAPTLTPPPAPADRGLIAAFVAAGCRVVAPDMRGHGASGKPVEPSGYAGRAMARDVLALLDRLGLERANVLGYSMGSITTAHLLIVAPGRVERAVLGGISSWIVAGEPFAEFDQPLASGTQFAETAARGIEGEDGGFGAIYRTAGDVVGMDSRVGAAVMRGHIADAVEPAELAGVMVPVLVLNGDDDSAKGHDAGLARYFADLRFGSCGGDHVGAPFDPMFQQTAVEFLQ